MFFVLGVVVPVLLSDVADKAHVLDDASEQPAEEALYDQSGGAAAIDAVVDIFYRRVLSDAYIKVFLKILTWRDKP